MILWGPLLRKPIPGSIPLVRLRTRKNRESELSRPWGSYILLLHPLHISRPPVFPAYPSISTQLYCTFHHPLRDSPANGSGARLEGPLNYPFKLMVRGWWGRQ
jgi:hypothetical protein